ncbi:hypothetical protein OB920_06505 [Halobacteria archaeon HArc-gm2]|nr:hypothetical protein [Halobacteria archaeon HArc-gm2]
MIGDGYRSALRRGASVGIAAASVAVLLWATPAPAVFARDATAILTLAAGYGLLVATSGYVVAGSLRFAGADVGEEEADTGRAVGKVENVLILTLTLLGAYTALGLVFTAKSIVRYQDISSGNTTYYLTGSVANVTYSLVYGVALARVLAVAS